MTPEPIEISDGHAQIAMATIRLVGELGADRVTVADVTKDLGITRATMERQCPTEKDLWHITAGFITGRMLQSWSGCIRSNLPPRERLQSLLAAQIELITETPALRDILFSRRLYQNHMAISRELRSARTRFQQLLVDVVMEGKAVGHFPNELNPDMVARGIMELLQGIVLSWSLAFQNDIALDEVWARLDVLLGRAVEQQNTVLIQDEMVSQHDITSHLEKG